MVSFTYDSEGLVTLYFTLTIAGFVLIPLTYIVWPRAKDDEEKRLESLRSIHVDAKWFHKKAQERRKRSSPVFVKAILVALWSVFLFYVWKAMQIEVVRPDWSPYEELSVAKDATKKQIKSAYKKQSIVYHPDKCDIEEHGQEGCETKFMLIKQAYDILKDEDRRLAWDETGDTGEAHSMELGLALPEWIVKKENTWAVLGLYVLCFMVILPTTVGSWWYKSIKYNNDSILLSTSNMFQYFIYRSPTMQFKRLLQILTSAHEFDRSHNKEIKDRQMTDSKLMPRLMAELPDDKSSLATNQPMSRHYSVKARALIMAHLLNIDLEDETLQEDKDIVLSKCTMLISSMIQTMGEFITFHQLGKLKRCPHITTIDATMKMSALMIQGIQDGQNPIFQLPYLTDRNYSYLQKKKIKSLKSLACLTDAKRRDLLKNLSDQQYEELCTRLRLFPDIEMKIECSVEDDDEECSVTAGSLVTLNVILKRRTLGDLMKRADEEGNDVVSDEGTPKAITFGDTDKAKKYFESKASGRSMEVEDKKPKNKRKKKKNKKKQLVPDANKTEKDNSNSGSEDESGTGSGESEAEEENDKLNSSETKDEQEWKKFAEKQSKKEKQAQEDMSRNSHTVLAPKWPTEKQEHWWLYLTDINSSFLFTSINSVYNLVDQKETQLQFQAPPYPNIYKMKVVLRSDSYLDCDRTQEIKLYISPQDHVKKIDANEVWGDLESEDDAVRPEVDSDEEAEEAVEDSDAGSWEVDSD